MLEQIRECRGHIIPNVPAVSADTREFVRAFAGAMDDPEFRKSAITKNTLGLEQASLGACRKHLLLCVPFL
eukprot:COSAG06_NODE_4842_length_3915_cov_2.264413_5_plen_71_part_00